MRHLATCFLLLGSSSIAQDEPAPIEAFAFAGRSIGGQQLDQDSFADSVLLVDLWGTWCPPCREAVPVLVGLYEKYKHHGLEIVGFCYAKDGSGEDVDKVRAFAIENRITYPLLIGTAAVREQVPTFRGYPTMLLFGRGGKHLHTHVGFDAGMKDRLETGIRQALGLKDAAGAGDATPAMEPVPAGKLFEPGNGDRGFELEVTDLAGDKLVFSDLRGAPVLLVMTTSWDQEATRTARFLQRLQGGLPGLRILAWHLERDVDPAKKAAAAREFLRRQGAGYRAFTTDMNTARAKVHRFASLPTLLLFDRDGTLVLREGGIADAIEERVESAARKLLE